MGWDGIAKEQASVLSSAESCRAFCVFCDDLLSVQHELWLQVKHSGEYLWRFESLLQADETMLLSHSLVQEVQHPHIVHDTGAGPGPAPEAYSSTVGIPMTLHIRKNRGRYVA